MYRTLTISLIALASLLACRPGGIKITGTRCMHMEEAVGVGAEPDFGWILESAQRGQYQTAYRICVNEDSLQLKDGPYFLDSGKILSGTSQNVKIGIPGLKPGKKYYWKVRVWDRRGRPSTWSPCAHFITALDEAEGWGEARWIAIEELPADRKLVPGVPRYGGKKQGAKLKRAVNPCFRKEFEVKSDIESALLFISALGHYKAWLNGKPLSPDHLTPGWSDYAKTCLYNTYEVTDLLQSGINTFGILAGGGFAYIHRERYSKLLIAHGYPMIIAKLQIRYTDGSSATLVSDGSWKTLPSPLTYSSIYGGETYDARLEEEGWMHCGFDDSHWSPVIEPESPGGSLRPEKAYPVRTRAVFEAKETRITGPDNLLVDFGQNASGMPRIAVKGKRGDTIRITPSELLDENGRPTQQGIGRSHYYEYILKGKGEEVWQPAFTYYGFRYAEISGICSQGDCKGKELPELLEIHMLHTANATPETGSFHCSNPLFEKIDSLIRWGMISNMQSIMTDCPHREKLGWLEQDYLLGPSLAYSFHMQALFRKTLDVMMDAQHSNGMVPNIAPEYVHFGGAFTDSPEWGSAMIHIPWLLYKFYGDTHSIEKAWKAMLAYVDFLDSKAEEGVLAYGLGDWYDLGPEAPGFSQLTPVEATATASLYMNCMLLARMGELTGRPEEVKRLKNRANEIRLAYNRTLFDREKGVYSGGSQTSMAIPLSTGIVEEEFRERVLKKLLDSIRAADLALTAGDIGFHYLVDALTREGKSQLLYDMNNRDDVPGYGYQLRMGATALTESWQALPQKSNNHMMLGHLKEWFYKGLGGIRQTEESAGFKEVLIHPYYPDGLQYSRLSYQGPYGTIQSAWEKEEDFISLRALIPVNSTAIIVLPTEDLNAIRENGRQLKRNKDLQVLETRNGQSLVRTSSGHYYFEISY